MHDIAIPLFHLLDYNYGLIEICSALEDSPKNVRAVLRRQLLNNTKCDAKRPICKLQGEDDFYQSLTEAGVPLKASLFTIARVWDEAHIRLCKAISAKEEGKSTALIIQLVGPQSIDYERPAKLS